MTTAILNFNDIKFSKEFNVKKSEGYMGSTGFEGSKSKERLYGSKLSAAIRKDLRANVPVTKKSNINVKSDSGFLYQDITVTIKLERDRYAKPYREVLKEFGSGVAYKGLG